MDAHTIDGMTAAQHREAAQASSDAEQASFERSDTDGFLSQWAHSMTARLHNEQAALADAGGMGEWPALFDLNGNLVPAKLVSTRFGIAWGILPSDDPDGRFVAWFSASSARKSATRRVNDAKKGYRVGRVLARTGAKVMGSGTGLSGAASAYVGRYRQDGGFSRDVTVLDDGTGELSYLDER
jgi:hypothetical protein